LEKSIQDKEGNDMFKKMAFVVASCGALLSGCGADPQMEIIGNLIEAGFPANDIMVVDGEVFVGRDALVTLEASQEMIQPGKEKLEQYRTTNLVSSSVTKICVVPTSQFEGLQPPQRGARSGHRQLQQPEPPVHHGARLGR
jgi:hypothetical protein